MQTEKASFELRFMPERNALGHQLRRIRASFANHPDKDCRRSGFHWLCRCISYASCLAVDKYKKK